MISIETADRGTRTEMSTRIAGMLATWRSRRRPPPAAADDGDFCPHVDEVRQVQRQARRLEVRTMLEAAMCP